MQTRQATVNLPAKEIAGKLPGRNREIRELLLRDIAALASKREMVGHGLKR
jgi:hypothetical protein